MTQLHIDPYEAAAQAAALARQTDRMRDHLPGPVLSHFLALVRDPRSSSDLLLLTADALREAADADRWPERGATLARLADLLANLAPTRATPLDADVMCRAGKKAAGRLLDDIEHNEVPG